jgi:hypothetical protein
MMGEALMTTRSVGIGQLREHFFSRVLERAHPILPECGNEFGTCQPGDLRGPTLRNTLELIPLDRCGNPQLAGKLRRGNRLAPPHP